MAKSIKLGSDTYLDASGIVGLRGTITSGSNLNDYRTQDKNGAWYVGTAASNITNCPSQADYPILLLYTNATSSGGGAANQLLFNYRSIWFRTYSGNPATWSDWKRVMGTAYTDISGTTESSANAGWYYVDITPSGANKSNCRGVTILNATSNRPVIAQWISESAIRLYSITSGTAISARLYYQT